jgi:hypothetical protein
MPDVRIFLSFDLEHDGDLWAAMLEQSHKTGSGFRISARSEARQMSDLWEQQQRCQIRDADEVIVVCGAHTADSVRMSAELRIVQEEEKPYFLLWGRREIMCTRPTGARPRDSMYSWTPDILRTQIAYTLRKDRPIEALKSFKRGLAPPDPGTGNAVELDAKRPEAEGAA